MNFLIRFYACGNFLVLGLAPALVKDIKTGDIIPMRRRAPSTASSKSSVTDSIIAEQELDSLYDYLAKIILLGPSGCGKSCILHRFVQEEWKVLTSQTIGVEFSSKIVKVGQGPTKRNLKLQLWDTAGQERFRSLTRGYYRGSAGVLLVYDISNRESFDKLGEFLADVKSLTAPNVSIIVIANKVDLQDEADPSTVVRMSEVLDFCARNDNLPLIHTSALSGQNIEEAFTRLASMILTKVELGVVDPEDIDSGVQYGEVPRWDSTLPRSRGTLSLGGLFGGRRQRQRSSYSCC
jgi:small GTP-binding protein